MKYLLSALAYLMLASLAQAHDFWLSPSSYVTETPGTVSLAARIGHAQDQDYWAADPDRIISLRHFSPGGLKDLQSFVQKENKVLPVSLKDAGLHMLAIETTHAFSELPAKAFEAYVKEEGLTPISNARKDSASKAMPGREIYSRRGKALVLVGERPAALPDYVSQPIGMSLEVVAYPYADGDITAQIFYRGKPLTGAQVVLVSLDTIAGDIATKVSDKAGHVSFRKPSAGQWMIHTVWSDPIKDHPMGDFDTTFSSLSFGY